MADDYSVVCGQVKDLSDFCHENFHRLNPELAGVDRFPEFDFVSEDICSDEELIDASCFVYMSDSAVVYGFVVNFVACTHGEVLGFVRQMVRIANMAINFIHIVSPEEGQWVKAGQIYFNNH